MMLPLTFALGAAAHAGGGSSDFAVAMDKAMDRMMADMHVAPTGDVDRDFVTMMIPHHQGAIDMSVAVLNHGRNPQLKRIAQEIIVEQQQEIAAMRLAIGDPLPPSMPVPTQQGGATDAHREGH
ncbi:hypothetical protein DMC47_16945 [Nostoc sp. 3335mG]|nr:hypothetical protein DMC47_16945 [Nostoc sp. 3335mG]